MNKFALTCLSQALIHWFSENVFICYEPICHMACLCYRTQEDVSLSWDKGASSGMQRSDVWLKYHLIFWNFSITPRMWGRLNLKSIFGPAALWQTYSDLRRISSSSKVALMIDIWKPSSPTSNQTSPSLNNNMTSLTTIHYLSELLLALNFVVEHGYRTHNFKSLPYK